MQIYVGYGFNAGNVRNSDILRLLYKYDTPLYNRCMESVQEEEPDFYTADMIEFIKSREIFSIDELSAAVSAAERNGEIVPDKMDDVDMDVFCDAAAEIAAEQYGSLSDFLCDVINKGEEEAAKTNDIVTQYDSRFVVFDSVAFIGDCEKRANYIKTRDDFIAMVARYVSTENIIFGALWEGSDLDEPNFFIE